MENTKTIKNDFAEMVKSFNKDLYYRYVTKTESGLNQYILNPDTCQMILLSKDRKNRVSEDYFDKVFITDENTLILKVNEDTVYELDFSGNTKISLIEYPEFDNIINSSKTV